MPSAHCHAHSPYLPGCPDCRTANTAWKRAYRARTGTRLQPRYTPGPAPVPRDIRSYGPTIDARIARAADAMFTTVDDYRRH